MALCVLASGLAALSFSRWDAYSRCRAPQLCAAPERVAEPQISVLDEWEELPDGRFTGRLLASLEGAGAEAGAEVWITPRTGSRDTDIDGTARITSAGGRPYLLGAPRTEVAEADGALAGLDALVAPLQIYKKSAVVGKYIEENAPPAVREAMRERDAGFLRVAVAPLTLALALALALALTRLLHAFCHSRVAVGVAVLAYAAGVYVGSQPMDMAPGEQPVLASWHGRPTATSATDATVAAGASSAAGEPLTLQGARTLQGTVGEQRLRQEVLVDRDRTALRELEVHTYSHSKYGRSKHGRSKAGPRLCYSRTRAAAASLDDRRLQPSPCSIRLQASGVPTPMGLLPRDEPTALRLESLRSQLRSSQVHSMLVSEYAGK